MLPLRFVPYHLCTDLRNVVVDGSANAATCLTLSHWPGSPTPMAVRDDLSAQIALRSLDVPELFDGVDVVTNNHFDQDGLCSAYALVHPRAALARRERVVDVARAGDFGTFQSRDAARIAFAIAALEDPNVSTLGREVLAGSYPERCGRLYEALLPMMDELLDHPDRFRPLWDTEDAHLGASLAAVRDGVVTIAEIADIDLAIITVPPDWAQRMTHRFTQSRTDAVHPMALNQATSCLRLLVLEGDRCWLECRYETWVMMTSRIVTPRPDLRPLAGLLEELEPDGAAWRSDAPGSLTPRVAPTSGLTAIAPTLLCSEIERFLRTAPGAWDPVLAR
ncbi:MAG TPA: DUF6687 family protein [Ilumatobacteraceae bacterium]